MAQLQNWLAERGRTASSTAALAGDLSQRRYFRVDLAGGGKWLAAYYPETLRPAMARFVAARELLAGAGVRVPGIGECDEEAGWMLVEDLGLATLYERADLAAGERIDLFHAAARTADRISRLDPAEVTRLGSPPLDAAALRRELEPTFEFLLDPRGLGADAGTRRALGAALDELCTRLAGAALVACHRDYMARNLIPDAGGVAVIDFQDLRLGPAGYDLASLLNDSFFPEAALEEALLPESWRAPALREQYSRAVVQRTLKAGGTFARFAAQGNPRHVPLIAPTMARAADHLETLPETAAVWRTLRRFWAEELAPAAVCGHLLK